MDLARLPWQLRYEAWRGLRSTIRRVNVRLSHRHCAISFGPGCYLGPGFELDIPGRATLRVGANVTFRRGFTCQIREGGRVTIGDDCIFGWDQVIQCSTSVDIRAGSLIGSHVVIADGNHRYKDPTRPLNHHGYDFRPITIGPEAMVGNAATITNSVGERTFVGANSVVTRPIPAYCTAVGAPARVIDRFGPADGSAGEEDA